MAWCDELPPARRPQPPPGRAIRLFIMNPSRTLHSHFRFRMSRGLAALGMIALIAAGSASAAPDHGDDPQAGASLETGGVKLYYEIHGTGDPLLVLHPNGGSISSMSAQIAHFSKTRRVIAVDSRGHGRTSAGKERLHYRKMAGDMIRLLDHLSIKRTDIIGWSDGGILGLMIAIERPQQVGKLVAMGANLDPDGAADWAKDWLVRRQREVDARIASGDDSADWGLEKQKLDLMQKQPDITVDELAGIRAATLLVAGDKDVIRAAHSQEMFERIPRCHLFIAPGATHMMPAQDPEMFNRIAERFLKQPFRRPDTRDFMR